MCTLVLAGCCITPPLAERYFDRSTPLGTVKMFQYSVETEQFDTAYACTTPEDREQMTPTQFQIGTYLSLDEINGYSLREFLANATRLRTSVSEESAFVVLYWDAGETGFRAALRRIEDEWFVDIRETLSGFAMSPE